MRFSTSRQRWISTKLTSSAWTRRRQLREKNLKDACDFDLETKKLKDPSVTIADVCTLFGGVQKRLPSTNARLKPNSAIVISQTFEPARVKIQSKQEANFSLIKQKAVKRLLELELAAPSLLSYLEMSFPDRPMRRQTVSLQTFGVQIFEPPSYSAYFHHLWTAD